MKPKTWKPEYDAAQKTIAEKNEEIRALRRDLQIARATTGVRIAAGELAAGAERMRTEVSSLMADMRERVAKVDAAIADSAALSDRVMELQGMLVDESLTVDALHSELAAAKNERADALHRLHLYERREADLFHRLTKSLAKYIQGGWQGRTVRSLAALPEGQAGLQAMLAEALDWCNERVRTRAKEAWKRDIEEFIASAPSASEGLHPSAEITEADVVEITAAEVVEVEAVPAEPPALPPEAEADEHFPDGPGADDMLAEIEALSPTARSVLTEIETYQPKPEGM